MSDEERPVVMTPFGFTVRIPADESAIVSHNDHNGALYCHRCRVGHHRPCVHITAALEYLDRLNRVRRNPDMFIPDEVRAAHPELSDDTLRGIASSVFSHTVERLRSEHGDDLEALTDEWIKQVDHLVDFPGPDGLVVRTLDWLLPGKLFAFLDFAVAKVRG